ncbi:hypothetical protein X772_08020 [Mesorhizobium sp. LSJC280B00]|nr:hypothetical protein X772_08020 [Mesorhizobium sp. LSJC280B00]
MAFLIPTSPAFGYCATPDMAAFGCDFDANAR